MLGFVLQRSELNLKLRFGGGGAFGENFQNKLETVDDFDMGGFGEVIGLQSSQGVVEDDFIGTRILDELGEFLDFAGADLVAGVCTSGLFEGADDGVAGGLCQSFEFFEA